MPFKRPGPDPTQQAGLGSTSSEYESSTILPPPTKHFKASTAMLQLDVKVYIVQAKLDPSTLAELFTLGERHTKGVCKNAADADVIITAIGMRRRLERHVPWSIAKSKAVVNPQWLRDSVQHGSAQPCDDYVAIEDLRETTVNNCPDCNCVPCACSSSSLTATPVTPPLRSLGHLSPPSSTPGSTSQDARRISTVSIPDNLLPPNPPIPTDLTKLDHTSRYACQRASPLVCPNQDLVRELDIIRQSRILEGEDRSALSYQRALSVIKAYPEKIRSLNQVQKLPYIGAKISGLVEEFLDSGKIIEARKTMSSERFQALSLFSTIYGIGSHTGRRLYNLGLRSLDDLEIYYGVEPEAIEVRVGVIEVEEQSRNPEGIRGRNENDDDLSESWIKVALGLRDDLNRKIPRDEVGEIGRVIMNELDKLEPGCVSTIVGGYRRGKPDSNDVDIVFTHPDSNKINGLCKRFVKRLHERGMVTHVMHLSGFHSHNPLRTGHWDSLEKSLTVFILPPSSSYHTGLRRRLDLIFAPPEVYWTAVIGWSGSVMFQRDLRQWAKDKHGMKFDSSGITRMYDSGDLYPKTEKEVFDLLGLQWIDPTLRNADL
ncbi:Nucleotidyltransferase [Trametes meyenii]|nr:Nucleotidyltransferase [Trametes meyenii]